MKSSDFFFFLFHPPLQRSLASILFPPPPASLAVMRREQAAAFARRAKECTAVVQGEAEATSVLYWLRSLVSSLASLLVVLVAFVLWPVHDVLVEPGYWWGPGLQDHLLLLLLLLLLLTTTQADLASRWECALQCSCIWTALVAAFLIISSHTYLALERTFGLVTFFLMWWARLIDL